MATIHLLLVEYKKMQTICKLTGKETIGLIVVLLSVIAIFITGSIFN